MADNNVNIKVTADTASATGALNKIGKQMDDVGKSVEKTGNLLTKIRNAITIAFAVDKISQFGGYLMNTTAEIQSMDAQFNQVFQGTEGVQALKAINEQAKSINVNADRLKTVWSSVDSQLKGAGMSGEKALEGTIKATTLATDASAFYDISLETSTQMLQSFMKGNFEAGDAIGVFTSAKQMDARATEMYGKKWQDLSEQERQWLLLDTVKRTYDQNGATGQAVREQNNWANVTANLTATWERFLSVIGAPILIVVSGIINTITNAVTSLTASAKGFSFSALVDQVPALGALFTTLSTVFVTVKTAIIDLVTSIVTKVQEWYANNSATVNQIIGVFSNCFVMIGQIIKDAVTIIQVIWNTFGSTILSVIVLYLGFIMERVQAFLEIISGVFHVIASLLTGDWEGAWEGIKSILSGALTFLITAIVGGLVGKIGGLFKSFADGAKGVFTGIREHIQVFIFDIVHAITNWATTLLNIVGAKFPGLSIFVGNIFKGIYDLITNPIGSAVTFIKGGIDKIIGFFANMKITLPKIALPHFDVSGKLSINPPSVPKLSIDWYKDGGYFDTPSVIGVGEAGGEAVVPLSNSDSMSKIGRAVASFMPDNNNNSTGGNGEVVNYFNVQATIREEADITKLSKELYKEQERGRRGRGGK